MVVMARVVFAPLLHLTAIVALLLTTTLLSLLATLTVVATHCADSREVYLESVARHNTYIANDGVVVRMLVVELIALGTHISCDIRKLLRGSWRLLLLCN